MTDIQKARIAAFILGLHIADLAKGKSVAARMDEWLPEVWDAIGGPCGISNGIECRAIANFEVIRSLVKTAEYAMDHRETVGVDQSEATRLRKGWTGDIHNLRGEVANAVYLHQDSLPFAAMSLERLRGIGQVVVMGLVSLSKHEQRAWESAYAGAALREKNDNE